MNMTRRRRLRWSWAVLGASLFMTVVAPAATHESVPEVFPSVVISAPVDPAASPTFPTQIAFARFLSLDEDGDRALFANIYSDVAYIYKKHKAEWEYEARLPFPGYTHGEGALLSKDVALVLATNIESPSSFTNASLVFRRTGASWSLVQTIPEGPNGATYARDDDGTIAIGRVDAHAVSIYTQRPHGELQLRAQIEEPVPNELFGASISLDHGTLVVGAPYGDHFHGLAYVYHRRGAEWKLDQQLAASDPQGLFGAPVSIKGGLIVVGAVNTDEDLSAPVQTVTGAAYVFANQGGAWYQQQKIRNPTNGTFAQHVAATDGKRLYISAHYIRPTDDSTSTIDSVAKVYVYRRIHGEWTNTKVLVPPTPSNNFALAASLAHCRFLTSDAYLPTPDPVFDGEAYIYETNRDCAD